jgi:hypothetical protein
MTRSAVSVPLPLRLVLLAPLLAAQAPATAPTRDTNARVLTRDEAPATVNPSL